MARKLEVEIVGDASSLNRALGSAQKSTSSFGSKMAGLGKAAAVGLVAVGAAAAVAGKKMVELASDAAEVDSKLEVVFGKTLPGVSKQLDAFSRATGASRYELREQAADMGALLGPLTGSKQAAADMSVQFTKLASDLGSFNNVPTADALLAIRSGLVGEAEPLRRFGVLLNEAAVKQEAMRLGLVKGKEELTEQQKVMARASLIMQQTTQAQGDATRTAGSMSNQMKALRNNLVDAATALGAKLLPIALAAVKAFNEHWPQIEKIVTQVLDAVIDAVSGVVTTIAPIVAQLAPTIQAAVEGVIPVLKNVGKVAASAFEALAGAIADVVGWFQKHKAAVDVLLPVVGGLATGIAAAAAAMQIIAIATKAWAAAQLILNVAMAANPFVLIAAAVVALGAALVIAYQRSETFRNIVNSAFESIKNVVLPIVNTLRGLWEDFGDDILRIGKAAFAPMVTFVKTAMANLAGIIRLIAAVIRGDWSEAWDQLKGIVSRTLGAAVTMVKQMAGNMLAAAKAIGKAILEGVVSGLQALGQKLLAVLGKIPGWLAQAAREAGSAALAIGKAIVSGILSGLGDLAGAVWAQVKGALGGLVDKAKGLLGIGSPSRVFAEIGRETVRGFILGINEAAPELPESMTKPLLELEAKVREITERRQELERAVAVREAEAAVAAARKKGEGVIAAEQQLAQAREAVVLAGLEQGIAKEQAVLERRAGAMQAALEKARAVVERHQVTLVAAFDKLGEYARRAFEAQTEKMIQGIEQKFAKAASKIRAEADALASQINANFDSQVGGVQAWGRELTESEKALQQIRDTEAQRGRDATLAAAQTALAKAQEITDTQERNAAIIAATEQLRQAELSITVAGLEEKAAAERAARDASATAQVAALEAQRAAELAANEQRLAEQLAALDKAKTQEAQNLEERRRQLGEKLDAQLELLRNRLAKHPEEYDKIQKKIVKLLKAYDGDFKTAGENLGEAFAKGIDASARAVEKSAKNLAQIVAKYLPHSPAEKGPLSKLPDWDSYLTSGLNANGITRALSKVSVPTGGMHGGAALAGAAGGRTFIVNVTVPPGSDEEWARRKLVPILRRELQRQEARNA
jgi:phage-related protein